MRLQGLTYTLDLPAQLEAASRARRHTQRVLGMWQTAEEDIEVATLLVSELVTNAVTHGTKQEEGCAPAEVALTLRQAGSKLWIKVKDVESTAPFRRIGLPDVAEAGRGITIVSALAECWGYELASGGGKDVWCVLRLSQAREVSFP